MIQFPETARVEWEAVADAANAAEELRLRIERGTKIEKEVEHLRVRHAATTIFQQEQDSEQTPVLEMMTVADYQSNPSFTAPVDLIEGVLKDNSLCLVLGPSGSGKSTIAMQMVHSLSTGDDWLGQTSKPLTGAFGILSYDMDAAMMAAVLVKYPGLDMRKVSIVNAFKRGNPLGVPEFRRQIAAVWKQMGVEVVVLDSFSASFFGVDQNDAAATMHHYRDLKLFALTEVGAKALVVIVHSTESKPDKVRGSTVHHDVADSIVGYVAAPTGERTARMVKYRAAPGQHQMSPVIVSAPDSVTHLVGLDIGAMSLAGMQLPAGSAAAAFTDVPEPIAIPDTESEQEDDDL